MCSESPLPDSLTCVARYETIGLRINTVLPNPLASVVLPRSSSFIIYEQVYQRADLLHERIYPSASAMRYLVLCALLALAAAQPAKNENWKTAMDEMVGQSRSECSQKNDEIACMKFKMFNLLDQIFSKDNFKASTDEIMQSLHFSSVLLICLYANKSINYFYNKIFSFYEPANRFIASISLGIRHGGSYA